MRRRSRRTGDCAAYLLLLTLLFAFPAGCAEAAKAAKPKPAKLSVSGYGLLGNRQLKRMLVTLELAGKVPETFSPGFIEDATLILTSRVKRDGYLEPTIDIHLNLAGGGQMQVSAQQLMDNPLPRPLRIVGAKFNIHKGVLFYFESLRIDGLKTLTQKQASSYFLEVDTLIHPKRGRTYTPDRLSRGLSSLKDILDQQGYQQATAEVAQLETNNATGAVRARVQVVEGAKSMVRSVREQYAYPENANAPREVTVSPNRPLSRLWLQDFTLSIKTNLYKSGYPDAAVQIETVQRTPRGAVEMVDLLAKVTSGPQVRLGGVEFQGQQKTKQRLLARRVRVERGELLDPIRIEEGRYRLARLGIFDTAGLDYHSLDEHLREVVYQVKESKTLNLSLLFGWGSYELLRGGVEAEWNNIWGLAHHANFSAVQSFKSTSGQLTYTVPEFVGRDIDLFLNASGLRREEVSFTRLEYGGGFGLHKYFQPEATDASIRYSYRILNALDFSTVQEVATEGLTNPAVGSIILEIKHDRRDNPLYPRRGYKVFFTIESATSYLGGDANFERVEISPSWHHPLGGGRYLSLGVSHGVDYAFGSAANNLPFNSRFFPGGENSIRGYRESEASPRNSLGQLVGAETYTLGTVELEQALTAKWSVVLFSDSLAFARRIEHYPCDTSLFAVGAGLRWRTLIGPVRLEYGHNLNPRPGDPSGTLLFSLGFPF